MAGVIKALLGKSDSAPESPRQNDGDEWDEDGFGPPAILEEPHKQSAVNAYFAHLADSIVNVPPFLGRARVPEVCKWRDKEGLLGEILDLTHALRLSKLHLKEHRHEYVRRLAENRKLERRVEELELAGNYAAPRSGGVVRLEARAKGLEAQYHLLTDVIANRKHGELYELSRDLCATRTRETEVERDTYAAEIRRLQILLHHIKLLYSEAQSEKSDYSLCKKKLEKLTVLNPRLQQTIEALQVSVSKVQGEIQKQKAKGDAARDAVSKWLSKFSSFESQAQGLNAQLKTTEKTKHQNMQKLQKVGFERMQFNKQLKEDNPNLLLASR